MNGKKFLVTAVTCAAFMLGLSGTTSAAEVSKDFSTLQVESQDFAGRWGNPGRHYPPPPRNPGNRGVYGGSHQTGWGNSNSGRNSRAPMPTNRRSGGNVIVISRV